jgi:hypothetical protein
MSLTAEDLKRVMANKTDEELYDVLYGHPGDYTPDAVEAAKLEFGSRNVDVPTLSTLESDVEVRKQVEEAPLGWGYRIIAFFISTIFFGVPVILAHRRYVEKGARRKAREWARWGLFGFFFYFAMLVLRYMLPMLSH